MLFRLPAFVGNIASASTDTVSGTTGTVTVTLPPTTRTVTVRLKHRE